MENGMSPYNHRETQQEWLKGGGTWEVLPGGTVYEECPRDLLLDYGYEAVRLYELFAGRPVLKWNWEDGGIDGVYRFLARLWLFAVQWRSGTETIGMGTAAAGTETIGMGTAAAGAETIGAGTAAAGAETIGAGTAGVAATGVETGGAEAVRMEATPEGAAFAAEMRTQITGLWERGDGHGTVAAFMSWFKKLKAFAAVRPVERKMLDTMLELLEPFAPAFCSAFYRLEEN